MNVEALKEVQKRILAKPDGFDMSTYIGWKEGHFPAYRHGELLIKVLSGEVPECNTTCCIAGEALLIKGMYSDTRDMAEQAQEFLGLTDKQANWLFLGWFSENHMEDITAEEASKAIQSLIDE